MLSASINECDLTSRTRVYEVQTNCAAEDPEWDALVLNGPDPHHEQTSLWGSVQRLRGWHPVRVQIRTQGSLVGGAQILMRQAGRVGKVAYLNRGPLTAIDDNEVRRRVIHAVQDFVRAERIAYHSVVLPYHTGSHWVSHLRSEGYAVRPPILPPKVAESSTIVLDLTLSLDEILARMRRSKRTYVKQGLKRGLRVREGGAGDLDTFNSLLGALCWRRGVVPNIPLGGFVHEVWRRFSPHGYAKLFVTEFEHQAVGALIVFAMGRWVRAWRIGWSGEHADRRPTELIYWEVLKWAKANGYEHFEIAGFDTDNARAVVEGREVSQSEWCEISFFKLGFGGQVLLLHPGYCFFLNPIVRTAFNLVGRHVLGSRIGERFALKALAGFEHRA